MKKYIGVLYSAGLYALKKNNSNCSFNLISSKCDTSYINYTFSSSLDSCILLGNKNTLVSLSINLKKFVKIIIFNYSL
ncbi:hypothetical protein [Brachyspira hyodysenteriae]|nr:hypothetical protein [Brachyspira hyodysenteriae]MCZ9928429.1 hypothetical protein [Brachyspira hyodysenteriae]